MNKLLTLWDLELFLEILEDTEAIDWYIDPRPCSKLRVLVAIPIRLLKSLAPHMGTMGPSQAQTRTRNRIHTTHDRVDRIPLMAYPALRFLERMEGLQDQLAEDTKNNVRELIARHVHESVYREDDPREPCANPDTPPIPPKNDRDIFNDALRCYPGLAPNGLVTTEIPAKQFKKMVDDFAEVLESYHDEIQNSEYT